MKKFLSMLVAVGLVAATSDVFAGDTSFGVRLGVSLANLTGSDLDLSDGETKKMRAGIASGAYVAIKAGDSIVIQPELLYIQKGTKLTFDGGSFAINLDYVEIPILLKYIIGGSGSVTPSLFIGPSIGFLMTATVKDGESNESDIKESQSSSDFGLVFGGGLDFEAGSLDVGFDVRYGLGLTPIDKKFEGFDQSNIKNSAIVVSLGVTF